jgi:hypothetical protein
MTGIEIINLLEQIKDQRYTYDELVNEGIKVTLDGHTYAVHDIDEPEGGKACGRGEDENGVGHDLLFYREQRHGYECYSLVEATIADLS